MTTTTKVLLTATYAVNNISLTDTTSSVPRISMENQSNTETDLSEGMLCLCAWYRLCLWLQVFRGLGILLFRVVPGWDNNSTSNHKHNLSHHNHCFSNIISEIEKWQKVENYNFFFCTLVFLHRIVQHKSQHHRTCRR